MQTFNTLMSAQDNVNRAASAGCSTSQKSGRRNVSICARSQLVLSVSVLLHRCRLFGSISYPLNSGTRQYGILVIRWSSFRCRRRPLISLDSFIRRRRKCRASTRLSINMNLTSHKHPLIRLSFAVRISLRCNCNVESADGLALRSFPMPPTHLHPRAEDIRVAGSSR